MGFSDLELAPFDREETDRGLLLVVLCDTAGAFLSLLTLAFYDPFPAYASATQLPLLQGTYLPKERTRLA